MPFWAEGPKRQRKGLRSTGCFYQSSVFINQVFKTGKVAPLLCVARDGYDAHCRYNDAHCRCNDAQKTLIAGPMTHKRRSIAARYQCAFARVLSAKLFSLDFEILMCAARAAQFVTNQNMLHNHMVLSK